MNAQKDETCKPVTVRDIRQRKGGQPIVGLAAYTTPIARLIDPHADFILVGDSLGMTVYGLDSTLQVSVEMMIAHGQAVRRGTSRACVVVDLPFGSYQETPQQAFRTASHVLARTNAAAVKLEGGAEMAETVDFLARRGVPVLGHVGLMPQSVNAYGGYRARGRDDDEAARIKSDAAAIAEAGAFAVVVEGVVEPLARAVTEAVAVPTIGIGASPACDGQILVVDDMLGLGAGKAPRFVKQYAALNRDIETAVAAFAEDVRARRFPAPEHCYGVS